MNTHHTLNGVEVHTTGAGKNGVIWCSDWTQIDRLVTAGYLRRVSGGPGTFGHQDYYLTDQRTKAR